ncbi:signal peptidase II [Aurantimicrobium minutum]|uniref:signal peptidase II n=1 Tax=Aurantimicrobium minutum TaxID=708131 RepID=UPI00247C8E17|nr:signal peptidase II [Aurantimicrobium minutum]
MAVKRPIWAVLTLLGITAVVVYTADQLSKMWVMSTLTEGVSEPVLGNFLQFYFVRNPGAAFSLSSGTTWVFSILAAVVTVVIIVFARKIRSIAWAAVFGLLLGGTLGNLTDRLTKENGEGVVSFGNGLVIDFISTPWMMPAIYNVADIAIVSSMCLLVLLTLLGIHIDGTREPRKNRKPETTDAGATVLLGAAGTTSSVLGGSESVGIDGTVDGGFDGGSFGDGGAGGN